MDGVIASGQTSINQAVRTGKSLPADAGKAKIVALADRWSTWIVVIALTAADIALVDDEIKELPQLIALSRHMMTVIKINMTFSMALNVLAIVPAIIGTLNPVVGALVRNASSVLVITNSAFLLKWHKRR